MSESFSIILWLHFHARAVIIFKFIILNTCTEKDQNVAIGSYCNNHYLKSGFRFCGLILSLAYVNLNQIQEYKNIMRKVPNVKDKPHCLVA